MTEERVVYDNNEVVWAKIRGYPWWPAYVCHPPYSDQWLD